VPAATRTSTRSTAVRRAQAITALSGAYASKPASAAVSTRPVTVSAAGVVSSPPVPLVVVPTESPSRSAVRGVMAISPGWSG
jgi:hypothetical protein